MAKLTNEIEITLKQPISFHKGGEIASSNKLLIKAPTNIHRYKLLKLKQGFLAAMSEISAKNNNNNNAAAGADDKVEFDAQAIMTFMLMSSLDLEEYFKILKDILCQESCYVDGTVKLTDMLFESLSLEDSELVLGKYLESFLLNTWLVGK